MTSAAASRPAGRAGRRAGGGGAALRCAPRLDQAARQRRRRRAHPGPGRDLAGCARRGHWLGRRRAGRLGRGAGPARPWAPAAAGAAEVRGGRRRLCERRGQQRRGRAAGAGECGPRGAGPGGGLRDPRDPARVSVWLRVSPGPWASLCECRRVQGLRLPRGPGLRSCVILVSPILRGRVSPGARVSSVCPVVYASVYLSVSGGEVPELGFPLCVYVCPVTLERLYY